MDCLIRGCLIVQTLLRSSWGGRRHLAVSSYLCSLLQGGLFWSLDESKQAVHGFALVPSTQAASARELG